MIITDADEINLNREALDEAEQTFTKMSKKLLDIMSNSGGNDEDDDGQLSRSLVNRSRDLQQYQSLT